MVGFLPRLPAAFEADEQADGQGDRQAAKEFFLIHGFTYHIAFMDPRRGLPNPKPACRFGYLRPRKSATAHVTATAVITAPNNAVLTGTRPSNVRSGGRSTVSICRVTPKPTAR